MNSNVYLSIQMGIEGIRKYILHYLKGTFPNDNITAWDPKKPYSRENTIGIADHLVVYIDGWEGHVSELTRGVVSEIEYAVKYKIPIYLIYINTRNHMNIYNAAVQVDAGPNDTWILRKIEGMRESTADAIDKIKSSASRHSTKWDWKVGTNEKIPVSQDSRNTIDLSGHLGYPTVKSHTSNSKYWWF